MTVDIVGSRSEELIAREASTLFDCDKARITNPNNKYFLIIGFKRTDSCWENEQGEIISVPFIEESVIASGNNYYELLLSMREYQVLKGKTIERYLKDLSVDDCLEATE